MAVLVCSWVKLATAQNTDVETYICEGEEQSFDSFKESLSFDRGYSPPSDVLSVEYKTRDQRMLYGYMAKARDLHETEVPPRGYILILPGNAMYAQHLIPLLRDIARAGYDVYVYDYRGYGRSEGRSAVRALIEDAKELVGHLSSPAVNNGKGYATRNIYALSAGAAIAINGFGDDFPIDRLVLDGAPASVSVDVRFLWKQLYSLKCPAELDPVNRPLPLASRSLLINGGRDRVLRVTQDKARQKQFIENARRAGVCIADRPKLGHPFKDSYNASIERVNMTIRFFAERPEVACKALAPVPGSKKSK